MRAVFHNLGKSYPGDLESLWSRLRTIAFLLEDEGGHAGDRGSALSRGGAGALASTRPVSAPSGGACHWWEEFRFASPRVPTRSLNRRGLLISDRQRGFITAQRYS